MLPSVAHLSRLIPNDASVFLYAFDLIELNGDDLSARAALSGTYFIRLPHGRQGLTHMSTHCARKLPPAPLKNEPFPDICKAAQIK